MLQLQFIRSFWPYDHPPTVKIRSTVTRLRRLYYRAPIISPTTYAGKTYHGPVELLDIYKTTVGLAGLPSPQPGVQGDSLVPAFSTPTVPIKDFAISQTTRCHVSSQGISGNRYIEPATAKKYFAACVRTPRTDFDFMGYSIRTYSIQSLLTSAQTCTSGLAAGQCSCLLEQVRLSGAIRAGSRGSISRQRPTVQVQTCRQGRWAKNCTITATTRVTTTWTTMSM